MENTSSHRNPTHSFSLTSGVLLVSGTCVGAGMLALPIVTGFAGFFPSLVINILCWLFMLITGLLFLEATLWMKEGSNVLSMANHFFGSVGKWIGGAVFLFLYYSLEVSYIAGGTPIFTSQLESLGLFVSGVSGYLLFALFFGCIVFIGSRAIDPVNWILMIGLILSYILLVTVGSFHVDSILLKRQNWALFLFAAPTLFSAYGFHNVIPSLATLMNRHAQKLRLAIIIGTTIPFIIYAVWQWIIIGTISEEQIALAAAEGVPVTEILNDITGNNWFSLISNYFGYFALVTSFLGVSLSMVDFVADGLSLDKSALKRILVCLSVFIPPALFAAAYPHIFLEALGIAGGFGEAILNGLFPIAMVWIGRYHMRLSSEVKVWGGKPLLVVLTAFTILIMILEAGHLMGAWSFSS
jgi:tyrosine-specific transport protein